MVTRRSAKRRGARAEQVIAQRFFEGTRAYEGGIAGSTDIRNDLGCHVDVKSRASISRAWRVALDTIEATGANVVVVSRNDLYVVFAVTLVKSLGRAEPVALRFARSYARLPDTPFGWLLNMVDHAPPAACPMVVLHRKGDAYRQSVVLARYVDFIRWRLMRRAAHQEG